MTTHHTLDIHPIPEKVLYINEPQLADQTLLNGEHPHNLENHPNDNIRVYVPLDLSRDAILRRLQDIYDRYGYLTEANECKIHQEVSILVSQIEIYDQIWFAREGDCGNRHSRKATELVKNVLELLMKHEGCGETFPYDLVEELQSEYTLR